MSEKRGAIYLAVATIVVVVLLLAGCEEPSYVDEDGVVVEKAISSTSAQLGGTVHYLVWIRSATTGKIVRVNDDVLYAYPLGTKVRVRWKVVYGTYYMEGRTVLEEGDWMNNAKAEGR